MHCSLYSGPNFSHFCVPKNIKYFTFEIFQHIVYVINYFMFFKDFIIMILKIFKTKGYMELSLKLST
jgi:hypothetical protein